MLVLSDIVIVVKSPESIIIGNRILIYISIIINISTWVSLSYELFFIIIIYTYIL